MAGLRKLCKYYIVNRSICQCKLNCYERYVGLFVQRHFVTEKPLNTAAKSTKDFATRILENEKVTIWMKAYEDLVGLTGVRSAQEKVIKAEDDFLRAHRDRRLKQQNMQNIHQRLRAIHVELDKVNRGDEKYLECLTEEHRILKLECQLEKELENLEQEERETFTTLSSAVRESHEKERQRTERTKYWSITGSIIGVILGVIGTSLNNYLRMRELRSLVEEQTADSKELKFAVKQIIDTIVEERSQLDAVLSGLSGPIGAVQSSNGERSPAMTYHPPEHNQVMMKDVGDIKKSLTELKTGLCTLSNRLIEPSRSAADVAPLEQAKDSKYTADQPYSTKTLPDMEDEPPLTLEEQMKANSLWTVVMVYVAYALTLPVIYQIFKGS